jgi:uncharacterized membrane protein YgaE (UPF0421/DUF939 family)
MTGLVEPIGLVLGAAVWVGAVFPFDRLTREVVDGAYQRPLAVALAATLGTTAMLAWTQDPWFRYAVLGVCVAFVAFYGAVTAYERRTAVGT